MNKNEHEQLKLFEREFKSNKENNIQNFFGQNVSSEWNIKIASKDEEELWDIYLENGAQQKKIQLVTISFSNDDKFYNKTKIGQNEILKNKKKFFNNDKYEKIQDLLQVTKKNLQNIFEKKNTDKYKETKGYLVILTNVFPSPDLSFVKNISNIGEINKKLQYEILSCFIHQIKKIFLSIFSDNYFVDVIFCINFIVSFWEEYQTRENKIIINRKKRWQEESFTNFISKRWPEEIFTNFISINSIKNDNKFENFPYSDEYFYNYCFKFNQYFDFIQLPSFRRLDLETRNQIKL